MPPSKDFKPVQGDPPPAPATTANSRPQHSLPDPKPKLTTMKVAQKRGWPEVSPVPFLNPDPVAHLVGNSNKAPVIVDGQEMIALIDSGASGLKHKLPVLWGSCTADPAPGSVFGTRGDRGFHHPIAQVCGGQPPDPRDQNYNEDVLLLVIPTTTYSEMVPVMVGSKIIDRTMTLMTKGELTKVTTMWRQAHFGSCHIWVTAATPHKLKWNWVEKDVSHSSPRGDPWRSGNFCLSDVRGLVYITQKIIIPPFSTVSVHINFSVIGHCMQVHVLTEPMPGPQLSTVVVPMVTYGELHLRSSRVPICLCNLSTCPMEIPTKTVVEQVAPANQVPLIVLLTRTSTKSNKRDQFWRPWTSKASRNGLILSRSRPENCCSNKNTCLHAVTWTWAKLHWSSKASQWFSSLNLKLKYWEGDMDEESKPLTAFTVGPVGFYKCERMPMGLTNAPTTFQRLMETCLGDLNLHWCIIYLDYIVIFSKDLASHLERLEAVLWKLEEAGLKLKPSKCVIPTTDCLFRAHDFCPRNSHQWRQNRSYQKVANPENVMEIQSFLQFMGYYHWFIPKFMQVAWPLHKLTLGENAGKKKAAIQWHNRWQWTFDDLKRLCTTAPILAYVDFTQPFKLHTDACGSGLEVVLYQTYEDGTDGVIVYASRSLTKAESHYPTHKLEFLALKWAVVKKIHEYLTFILWHLYW